MRSSSRILASCSALIICVFLAACGGGGSKPPAPPAPLTITTSDLTQATVNVPYSFYLVGNGGSGSFTWSVSSGSLPPGLTLNPTSAQISGTPTAAGTFPFTAKVTDEASDAATANLTISVSGAIVITCTSCAPHTSNLPSGVPGTLYTATLTATGGVAPYTWCVVEINNGGCDDGSGGALPMGLTMDTSTGVISGTPTMPQATTQVTVEVKDHENPQSSGSTTISISIFGITTGSLPSGEIYSPYNQTLLLLGGTKPYSWCVIESGGGCDNGSGGALPAGITLSASCTGTQQLVCPITGTPTVAGSFPFTLQVTDSEQTPAMATGMFTITINPTPPLQITTSSLPAGTQGVYYSNPVAATGGVPPYSWSLTSGPLPTGLTLSGTGVIAGTPTGSSGDFPITVQVTDTLTNTASAPLNLTIAAGRLVVTASNVPAGTVSVPYSAALGAAGGTPPYTWTALSGPPSGLTLNSSTGVITGTPTRVGALLFRRG